MHKASNSPLRYISCVTSLYFVLPKYYHLSFMSLLFVPVRVLLTPIGLSTEYTRVVINIIVVNPKKSKRNSAYFYGSAIPRHLKTQRLHARVQGKETLVVRFFSFTKYLKQMSHTILMTWYSVSFFILSEYLND